MSKSHFDMIDAVNDAKTPEDRRRAENELNGWRIAADHFGHGWPGADADFYTVDTRGVEGEDLPMCCGVLLETGDAT